MEEKKDITEMIEEYLNRANWKYEKKKDNVWYFVIEIEEVIFPIIMKCSGDILILSAISLMNLPKSKATKRRILKKLLELNRQLKMAKIGIDKEGSVFMNVEYPIKDLSYSEFKDCCDALLTYLKHYWVPEIKTNFSGLVI